MRSQITTEGAVCILGAGGHAKVVVSTLQAIGRRVLAAYDDDPKKIGTSLLGVPVQGLISSLRPGCECSFIIGIGSNSLRHRIAQRLPWAVWTCAVHPRAFVHETVTLGPGTVVFAGAVVQPEARIGAHCIVNTGSTIDHECDIGDFCHIAPGTSLAGQVSIGEGVLMGIGSAVVPCVTVGAWSTVGAGGVVLKDLPPQVVAMGVPSRAVRRNKCI
jgi:sugar O-acyltransferase (sialic acid O-acetyltransferase NeuD family)